MKRTNSAWRTIAYTIAVLVVAVFSMPLFNVMRVYAEDDGYEDVVEQGYDPTFYSMNDILYYDPRAMLCGPSSTSASDSGELMSSDVPTSFTLGTDNSMRPVNLAKQLMADFSLSEAQAAGIVGNFMHESGGAHLPPDINEGLDGKAPYSGPPAFRGGYGWAQWTGGRQVTFIDFSVSKGYMANNQQHATDAANYGYLKYELIKTERSTIPAVMKTSTPADAATAFEANFERAGKPLLEKRIAYANQLYSALRNGTGVDTGTTPIIDLPTSSGCAMQGPGVSAGGRVFDTIVFPLSISKSGIVNGSIFKNGTTNRAGHPYIAFDILAPAGTQVVALADGRVTSVRPTGSMGGNVTIYNEQKKLHVYYTHMIPKSGIAVGDIITPGTPLGALASVKQYPKINADHLHIDAGTGERRLECSRSNPDGAACKTRVDIGPDLYNGWEKLAP